MSLLADIITRNKELIYSGQFDSDQFKALNSLRICRTAETQGSLYSCDQCESLKYVYHSCGHRFCPQCQNYKTTLWLHRQKTRLLACNYFMITFTLPRELHRVPRKDRRDFYNAFFDCTSAAIKELSRDKLKGTPGMVGVLHTNGRTLNYHAHIHYIVPAIVLNKAENTLKKISEKFLLHQQVLANLFRGKFLSRLKELEIPFPGYLYGKKWQADCDLKGNGENVLEYLSRYLIKGVVSPKAISEVNGKINLHYKDSQTATMKDIAFDEPIFIKKLAEHVLPKGFRRVREYGFLAPAAKKMLQKMQLLLKVKISDEPPPQPPKVACPCCKGTMRMILHKIPEKWFKEKIEPSTKARASPQAVV